jgi:hypothetical protein
MKKLSFKKKHLSKVLTAALVLLTITPVFASGGGAALTSAASTLGGYMTGLGKLIYAIAAIVGTVGGIRIYNKWTNGDQDINKELVGWGGACVFLLIVPTFISAIFV